MNATNASTKKINADQRTMRRRRPRGGEFFELTIVEDTITAKIQLGKKYARRVRSRLLLARGIFPNLFQSAPMLGLENISLVIGREPDEQTLLHEISTELPEAHFCAILGPSGCGKSTLLKVIAG